MVVFDNDGTRDDLDRYSLTVVDNGISGKSVCLVSWTLRAAA